MRSPITARIARAGQDSHLLPEHIRDRLQAKGNQGLDEGDPGVEIISPWQRRLVDRLALALGTNPQYRSAVDTEQPLPVVGSCCQQLNLPPRVLLPRFFNWPWDTLDRSGEWTLTEAARLLGEPQHRLIYLYEKGVVQPDLRDAEGRGSSRRFSARNLLECAVALRLRDLEIPTAVVGAVIYVLRALERSVASETPSFRFVGSTICYAFMQAAGLVNDHIIDCFRYREVSR